METRRHAATARPPTSMRLHNEERILYREASGKANSG
jgi:hypothetical protein